MALVLLAHENLGKDKHVESLLFPRLDEGSIPSSSTNEILKPLNFSGFFYLYSPLLPFFLLLFKNLRIFEAFSCFRYPASGFKLAGNVARPWPIRRSGWVR